MSRRLPRRVRRHHGKRLGETSNRPPRPGIPPPMREAGLRGTAARSATHPPRAPLPISTSCGYFCGQPQQEPRSRHGAMGTSSLLTTPERTARQAFDVRRRRGQSHRLREPGHVQPRRIRAWAEIRSIGRHSSTPGSTPTTPPYGRHSIESATCWHAWESCTAVPHRNPDVRIYVRSSGSVRGMPRTSRPDWTARALAAAHLQLLVAVRFGVALPAEQVEQLAARLGDRLREQALTHRPDDLPRCRRPMAPRTSIACRHRRDRL